MIALLMTLFFAQALPSQQGPALAIHNTILTQVNGTTISLFDVTKKMDLVFHQQYPNLKDSESARAQFYEASWRHVLQELIDQELILADATSKEVQLNDAEIREELEDRFGPNLVKTLDTLSLSYDDAWKMVKNELMARRMTGHFIYAKALQNVTPQDIRQAYQVYLKEHPPFHEWRYQIVTIHSEEATSAEAVYQYIQADPKAPQEMLSQLQAQFPALPMQLSTEYVAHTEDLSATYQETLASLQPHEYSPPIASALRAKPLFRLFYLHEVTAHTPPPFETLAPQLNHVLFQRSVEKESEHYLTQLRKRYGFDPKELQASIPADFHPFLSR